MNIFSEVLCKGTEHPDLKVSLKYPFLQHFWSVSSFSADDGQLCALESILKKYQLQLGQYKVKFM